MLIRVEIPVDAPAIDSLLRRTFAASREANLVQQLREQGLLTLGMVAVREETAEVIGYIAFSPVTLQGEDPLWVSLSPLAVALPFQRQGVGRALVQEGLNSLNEFSYQAVVVLGEPEYYGQLGFEPAAKYHLHCRWPGTEQAFQIYPLERSTLQGARGLVEYAELFDQF